MVAPLLVVPVLVERGAGRREQHRVARPREHGRARDRAAPSSRSARSRAAPASAVSIAPAASPIVSTARALRRDESRERGEVAVLVAAAEDQEHAARRESPRATSPWRPRWCPSSRRPSARRRASATSSLRCGRPSNRVSARDDRVRRRAEALGRGQRRQRVLEVVRARQREALRRRRPRARGAATSQRSSPASSHAAARRPPGRPRREKRTRRAAVAIAARRRVVGVQDRDVLGPCRAKTRALAAA